MVPERPSTFVERAEAQLDSIFLAHHAASMRRTPSRLASPARPDKPAPYTVQPHAGGFRPGIDPGKLNQLVDQLEVEESSKTL
jgi:hypothetical protein